MAHQLRHVKNCSTGVMTGGIIADLVGISVGEIVGGLYGKCVGIFVSGESV